MPSALYEVLARLVESVHADFWEMDGNYWDAIQEADINPVIKTAMRSVPVLCDSYFLLLDEMDKRPNAIAWKTIKCNVIKCRRFAADLEHVLFTVAQAPDGEKEAASKRALEETGSVPVQDLVHGMIVLTLTVLEADGKVKWITRIQREALKNAGDQLMAACLEMKIGLDDPFDMDQTREPSTVTNPSN